MEASPCLALNAASCAAPTLAGGERVTSEAAGVERLSTDAARVFLGDVDAPSSTRGAARVFLGDKE